MSLLRQSFGLTAYRRLPLYPSTDIVIGPAVPFRANTGHALHKI